MLQGSLGSRPGCCDNFRRGRARSQAGSRYKTMERFGAIGVSHRRILRALAVGVRQKGAVNSVEVPPSTSTNATRRICATPAGKNGRTSRGCSGRQQPGERLSPVPLLPLPAKSETVSVFESALAQEPIARQVDRLPPAALASRHRFSSLFSVPVRSARHLSPP